MADKLNRRIEVNVHRTVNIGNYESVKAGVSISQNIEDKAEEGAEFENLWEIAETQLDDYLSSYEGDKEEETPEEEEETPEEEEETPEEEEETPEKVEEEEEEEEEEELDITEEEINSMTKPELVELCKTTEGMEDIDVKVNLKPLRAMIIDLLFEEEEEEEEDSNVDASDEETPDKELDETGGDWDKDDWQDE